jgi:para-aminobenzoate synthetase/4-amino-4-deoxychorismate lyase
MHALIDFPGTASGPRCRQAFARARSLLVAEHAADVSAVIAMAHAQARQGSWVLGFVAYEAAPAFDPVMAVHPPVRGLPLACFGVYDAGDPCGTAELPRTPGRPSGFALGASWSSLLERPQALAAMARIRAAIARGEVYQVNLTTRLRTGFSGDAAAYFDALCRAQPGGYSLFLDGGHWQLLCVSPELFFDWTAEGELTARPMKGTAARHADPGRDAEQMRRMQASAKERAENLMIVDLLRNDLSRVAQSGSVQVPALFTAEALPTVWQMTSTVTCRTRAGLDLADIFGALFPCGSVTGAPKIAAMTTIAALEDEPRGAYCGALGVIRPGGHATFGVGIRTVMIDRALGRAECGIGSGITWDSREADEWEEWEIKQGFLARANRP